LHRLAIWPGLDGDKALAEELLRRLANLIVGLAQLDAAGFAAGAGVNLGLYGPISSVAA